MDISSYEFKTDDSMVNIPKNLFKKIMDEHKAKEAFNENKIKKLEDVINAQKEKNNINENIIENSMSNNKKQKDCEESIIISHSEKKELEPPLRIKKKMEEDKKKKEIIDKITKSLSESNKNVRDEDSDLSEVSDKMEKEDNGRRSMTDQQRMVFKVNSEVAPKMSVKEEIQNTVMQTAGTIDSEEQERRTRREIKKEYSDLLKISNERKLTKMEKWRLENVLKIIKTL